MKKTGSASWALRLSAAFAAAALASAAAEAKPSREAKDQKSESSRFVTIAPCGSGEGGGGLRWVNGRHPFQGGSGAYGDIFFGGGASSRPASVESGGGSNGNSGGSGSANSGSGNGNSGSSSSGNAGTTVGGGNGASATTPAVGAPGTILDSSVGAAATGAASGAAKIAVVTPAAVTPEPASLLLIGTGLGAVLFSRRRSRNQTKQ